MASPITFVSDAIPHFQYLSVLTDTDGDQFIFAFTSDPSGTGHSGAPYIKANYVDGLGNDVPTKLTQMFDFVRGLARVNEAQNEILYARLDAPIPGTDGFWLRWVGNPPIHGTGEPLTRKLRALYDEARALMLL